MKTGLMHSGEIDVTETAKTLGFKMQVVLSRRLWDFIEGPPDACRAEAETLEQLHRLLKTVKRELQCGPGVNFDFIVGRGGDFRVGAVALLADDHEQRLAISLAHETRRVTIRRSRWNRSSKTSESCYGLLFDGAGYCCLGFVCQQLFGKTDEEMLGKKMPEEVGIPNDPRGLPGGFVQAAVELNDRVTARPGNEDYREMSDAEQERRIAELFATMGIAVQFIE
jgi:hypothetical protein